MNAEHRQELALGYVTTALKAEQRRIESEAVNDKREASEWRKLAAYAWDKAERGERDDSQSYSTNFSFDEHIETGDAARRRSVPAPEVVEEPTAAQRLALVAANVGAGVLSPAEQDVALLTYGSMLKPQTVADMTGTQKYTVETHTRNARAKWRHLQAVGAVLGGTASPT